MVRFVLLLVLALCWSQHSLQAQTVVPDSLDASKTTSTFDIKTFLFSHIANAYDFHILTYQGTVISVPLPIILYSQTSGLHVFMSSQFHHGTTSYKDFCIATSGKYKDSIVELQTDGSQIRPIDLSISKNVFSVLFACFLLSAIFIYIKKVYAKTTLQTPKGIQAMLEPIILFVKNDVAQPALGSRTNKYLPYLLTLFFFILILNLMGLVPFFPFGANVTGNINVTLALALCTFIITMLSSNKAYWKEKLWTPGVPLWLKFPIPLMPLVEIVSIITGPVALMVRLFANMLSGHMVVLVLMSLVFIFSAVGPLIDGGIGVVAILFSVFMLILDVLISFIQAYVFTLLTALYFGGAKADEH